jgi:predicted xylose isomerase-like sugar epimerase
LQKYYQIRERLATQSGGKKCLSDECNMGKRILPFALNHMTAPGMPTDAFLDLATALGCVGVEIRSDLPAALFDAKSSEHVQKITKAIGLRILALA